MELKFENLQRAAYTFDRNLNTNLNIAPNESKHEFCCKGQIDKKSTRNSLQGAHRQDFLDLSKIFEKRASSVISFGNFCVSEGPYF